MERTVPGMFGEFPAGSDGQVKYFYLDLGRMIAEFAPERIPLAPFPGTIGVARARIRGWLGTARPYGAT